MSTTVSSHCMIPHDRDGGRPKMEQEGDIEPVRLCSHELTRRFVRRRIRIPKFWAIRDQSSQGRAGFYHTSNRDPSRTSSTACPGDMLFMNVELFSAPTPKTAKRHKRFPNIIYSITPLVDIHKPSRSPISATHFVITDRWIGLITFPRIV